MGQDPPRRIDRLVDLALWTSMYEGLPRKRRAKIAARVLAIARDWDRAAGVIDLGARRLGEHGEEDLREAAARLRRTLDAIDPKPPG